MKLPTAFLVSLVVLVAAASPGAAPEGRAAAPVGQVTWGVHTTLVPTYFDPAETMIVTPFMVMYALHDGLVKPMPGKSMAPSLAESWSVSPDGLVYEFVLRKGVRFHNGEIVTAEDVKFSFERYRGIYAKPLKERVAGVETLDAGRVRFRPKRPWPDFMVFYGTIATGAGWVVPQKYVEKVGDEGFKKAPVGAGPYRFVSFSPGIALVLEAFDGYWRKTPNVKRLIFRVIPDPSTRLAALKREEVDIVYSMVGELAEEVRRTPGFSLKPVFPSVHWRPLERAAFNKSVAEKKLRSLVQIIGGGFGNAATRLEAYVVSNGSFAYGGYPDLDGLFQEQTTELDRTKRESILQRIQQLVHERAMFAPIYELAFVAGVGRRMEESGLGLIAGYAFSAPYEDLKLKTK